MKIVYCLNAICYVGGIERVTIAKANALAALPENELWIVVTDNQFELPLPLSSKVHLIDLGVRYYVNQSPNPFIDLIKEGIKRHKHKLLLQQELEKIAPDILISVGQAEKYMLPSLKLSSKPAYIREIHFYKLYRRDYATSWQKKLIARFADWYDYEWKIKKYDAIISLTKTDRDLYWYGDKRVRVIPNPVIVQPKTISTCENKVVIAVGRLVAQKNFESLLRVWQKVEILHTEWSLQIWGEGELKNDLNALIENLGLKQAKLMGFSSEIIKKYTAASILTVTPRSEGFALNMLEAMASGLPIVSYDCPCCPRDIIDVGENGFLVKPGDEDTMAERLCWLMEHPVERKAMGVKAVTKAAHYQIDQVVEQWMSLFRELR